MALKKRYAAEFSGIEVKLARETAGVVLQIIRDMVPFSSVIDVGGGVGAWCVEAIDLGIEDILLVDGDYVDTKELLIPVESFLGHDLTLGIKIEKNFDLAICAEVGEHLAEQCAPQLIRDLTELSNLILFGAAIPGQGGTHHVNEQWPGYWYDLFVQEGFRCFDLVRPQIWGRGLPFWYEQNLLLYARNGSEAFSVLSEHGPDRRPASMVHAKLYESYRRSFVPGALKPAYGSAKGAVRSALRAF